MSAESDRIFEILSSTKKLSDELMDEAVNLMIDLPEEEEAALFAAKAALDQLYSEGMLPREP